MPREVPRQGPSGKASSAPAPPSAPGGDRTTLALTRELRLALRPWLDLDEVGGEGLRTWLLSILPLIPRPAGPGARDTTASRSGRVEDLARALAECAGDRARVHFQASEYFQENRALARRVKALEAMLRVRARAEGRDDSGIASAESDAASRRYLPPDRL
jgi:hypothetical protein